VTEDPARASAVAVSLDVSAVPQQPVGVGRFALELVSELSRRDDVSLTLFSRHADALRWDSGSPGAHRVSVRAVAPSPRPIRLLWEQLRLPGLIEREGVSVHHGPHYTMPERSRVPCVVTVHDLTLVDHPEWHERTKVLFFRRAIRVAARRATALLCDSEYTAQRMQELYQPSGRVLVVPLGVDLSRFRPSIGPNGGPAGAARPMDGGATPTTPTSAGIETDRHTRSEVLERPDEEILASLGVRRPYVLFLGTLEPRKAVPDLVSAFDELARRHGELSLVLAGRPGWGSDEVERRVRSARNSGRVHLTGYVPDEAVPALLRCAAVVAYPAKEEGFGLPALEALACGAPLVTTSGTVMSDLAGPAALTVTPGSVDELVEALEASVKGEGVEERRRAGLEVASHYSWQASAQAHVDAYGWAANAGSI
jgi:glycosyltransferase involved in cell wall biosynthesis